MNRIKSLREEAGIAQKELAKHFNVAQNTVSSWETGKRDPDTETVIRIANFFDVTIDYVLGNSDIKKAPSFEDAGLSPDEAALLFDFRKLTEDQKAFVLQAVKAEAIRKADEQK